MSGLSGQLDNVEHLLSKLSVKKQILLQKAMSSTSPNDILKAQKILQGIQNREQSDKKSFILDPFDFNQTFGYKDKPYMMSYSTLKNMSKTPVVNAIIKTRKNQVADFAEPQADKYSTGFIIRKKLKYGQKPNEKQTDEELRKIDYITQFILNCGVGNSWENDDFETFIRKITEDSLVYDQMTFEVIRDKSGQPYEFFATDASTYRIADSYNDDEYKNSEHGRTKEQIKGYYPNYVQVLNGEIKAEFYPWELCFGVRNPSTSIGSVGYGVSELEELVTTVTSMLWAEEYNRRFFSQGSAPKGLLRVKGQVNEKELSAFRQQWNGMIQGVQNAWKTPIVDADIDWIDLQRSNRDMEYNAWLEFLIKIACAIYSIDPNEIGFSINNSSGSSPMFEGKNEQRLKHSKDKGLHPILKFIQRKLNKYVVSQIDPDYELLFVGLNGLTIQEEFDMDTKKASTLYTVNEVRRMRGDDPIDGGDIILNPTYTQSKMMAEQQAQQAQAAAGGDDKNPFLMDDNEDDNWDDEENNPFLKSFLNNLEK